jgi:CheY-like chemotaxis protein
MEDEEIDLSSLRVLLVEDEKFAVKLESMVLKQIGITQVTVAEDGNAAIGLLETESFDIVLSDWNLPGTDGLDVLKFMRGRRLKTPFVMLTGNKGLDAVQEAVAQGVDGYLVKPFSVPQMKSKIISALRRQGRL